jgi:hypothetical protein
MPIHLVALQTLILDPEEIHLLLANKLQLQVELGVQGKLHVKNPAKK